MLFQQETINCKGRLLDLTNPIVMGVLNLTPDSFFDGGQYSSEKAILTQVERMLTEGASLIDIGGMSSRPGADIVSSEEELLRIMPSIHLIVKHFSDVILSVDTVHAKVAEEAVAGGVHIINDISGGDIDPEMFTTVANLDVPYVLMHMKGKPANMQTKPAYDDVVQEVLDFFVKKIGELRALGVKDVILDPGFGFGKTLEHNYDLLKNLEVFKILELPLLIGISRKSMIYKILETSASEALNGTTALHMVALQQGAKILRAHDVREVKEVIQLYAQLG